MQGRGWKIEATNGGPVLFLGGAPPYTYDARGLRVPLPEGFLEELKRQLLPGAASPSPR